CDVAEHLFLVPSEARDPYCNDEPRPASLRIHFFLTLSSSRIVNQERRDSSLRSECVLTRRLQRTGLPRGFNLHPRNAVAVHLEDGVAAAIVLEGLAAPRNAPELGQDESG